MKENRKILLLTLALVGLFALLIVISSHESRKRGDNTTHIKELVIIQKKQQDYEKKLEAQYNKVESQLQYLIDHPPKNGTNGVNGANGAGGKNGDSGKNGSNGNDGKSAYDLWLNLGNIGSPQEFINSLQGQDGTSPPEIELRCNALKLQNEWRYKGTSAWHALDKVSLCV